ncbi:uncharacterized protein LOC144569539 [Carex rostrata]
MKRKAKTKKMEPKRQKQKQTQKQKEKENAPNDSNSSQNPNQNPSSLAYYLLVVPPGASPPAGAAALPGTPPPGATAAATEAVKRISTGGVGVSSDAKSGSDDQDLNQDPDPTPNPNPRGRKRRFKRHTPHQIQELESYFIKNPHPDDKAREDLSQELGLEPSQVKFWFQNKRTQLKNQFVWQENTQLRAELDKLKAENDKLIAENNQFKVMLAGTSCSACGASVVPGELSSDEHRPNTSTIPPPEPCEEDDEVGATRSEDDQFIFGDMNTRDLSGV